MPTYKAKSMDKKLFEEKIVLTQLIPLADSGEVLPLKGCLVLCLVCVELSQDLGSYNDHLV